MRIQNLSLINFRNHSKLNIPVGEKKFIVITGRNGSGKTNILEAISILYPGRGLRSAKLTETIRWASGQADIKASLTHQERIIEIQARIDSKKSIEINGQKAKNHQELANTLSIVWFSPQICSLLISSNMARIKFIDRIAYSINANHAKLIIEYKKAMHTRNKLLARDTQDEIWLNSLEQIIAQHSIAIHNNRQQVISILMQINPAKAKITLQGRIAELVAVEKNASSLLQQKLKEYRKIDSALGFSRISIYQSPINIINLESNSGLNLCSTGEQKNLILSIIIAQIQAKQTRHRPIILLDDPMEHLDTHKKDKLLLELDQLDCQIWIADHNIDNYSNIDAQIVEII
ncbi:DNA replication and repair protein RecF [Rickettsiales bacterium]|nr:DNA replication and repair protein RecF [Rickettsiales bacterium]